MKNSKYLKLKDVALRLNRSKTTIIRWEKQGKIPTPTQHNPKDKARLYTIEDYNLIKELSISQLFYQRKPRR